MADVAVVFCRNGTLYRVCMVCRLEEQGSSSDSNQAQPWGEWSRGQDHGDEVGLRSSHQVKAMGQALVPDLVPQVYLQHTSSKDQSQCLNVVSSKVRRSQLSTSLAHTALCQSWPGAQVARPLWRGGQGGCRTDSQTLRWSLLLRNNDLVIRIMSWNKNRYFCENATYQ